MTGVTEVTSLRPRASRQAPLSLVLGSGYLVAAVTFVTWQGLAGWSAGWAAAPATAVFLAQGAMLLATGVARVRLRVLLLPEALSLTALRTRTYPWADIAAVRRDPRGGPRPIRLTLTDGKELTLPELTDAGSELVLAAHRSGVQGTR